MTRTMGLFLVSSLEFCDRKNLCSLDLCSLDTSATIHRGSRVQHAGSENSDLVLVLTFIHARPF